VRCPSGHPQLVEGGADATFLFRYPLSSKDSVLPYPVLWVFNHANGQGWTGWAVKDKDADKIYFDRYTQWTLSVWAKCTQANKGKHHAHH
jgi:hypothetical protein